MPEIKKLNNECEYCNISVSKVCLYHYKNKSFNSTFKLNNIIKQFNLANKELLIIQILITKLYFLRISGLVNDIII